MRDPCSRATRSRLRAADCLVTATQRAAPWKLLESLLWTPEDGYFLVERHLHRAAQSAAFFGWCISPRRLRAALHRHSQQLTESSKVRLLVSSSGQHEIESAPLATKAAAIQASVGRNPVDPRDDLLRHKTTYRVVYDSALADAPESDDVLLWNTRGEVTETCYGNLVFRLGDRLVTPALQCGLLPGVYRGQLLEDGVLCEGIVRLPELDQADEIYRINSVRKWTRLNLLTESPAPNSFTLQRIR
jgi:branched-subunit amino acid aminotransferase/4-amino-4-deoxychorismate lyase